MQADNPAPRLPPGQQWVAEGKWPVVGERLPANRPTPWTVAVGGEVQTTRCWTLGELQQLPSVTCRMDIHCVTRWSKPDVTFRGALLETLLQAAPPLPAGRYVAFVARSDRHHSTSLPLEAARTLQTLIAWECNGEPLAVEHGGPVRVVVPGRYFYKSLKWLEQIEVLSVDRLGYWEGCAGYHNGADPWQEQRYLASGLSRQQTAALLASRDIRRQELRSLGAAARALTGLQAEEAILRDADFRDCELRHARFDRANLSNAHFERADLREASFQSADLEGANFAGADLRKADFRGASLFGASFIEGETGARITPETRLELSQLEELTPLQWEYVRRQLAP